MSEIQDPHENEENPEEQIGEAVPDPWEDDAAANWPNEEVSA